jgi:transcription initiation factor TFIIIB Brf1 subunit/transcription initiation factor TFIIB
VRPWDGKSPLSLAAAILLITTRMPKATRMPGTIEIADVAQVAEVTVRTTAHMMYPFAKDFIPPSYATPDQIRKTINMMSSLT